MYVKNVLFKYIDNHILIFNNILEEVRKLGTLRRVNIIFSILFDFYLIKFSDPKVAVYSFIEICFICKQIELSKTQVIKVVRLIKYEEIVFVKHRMINLK